jgi:hypothetical protein
MKKVGQKMTTKNNNSEKSKKKTSNPSYFLKDLVPEITGVKKSNNTFDAEYQAVKRIVQVMKRLTGNNENMKKIPYEEKDGFVVVTRNFYNMIKNDQTGKGQELFTRMNAEKELTEKEYGKLISFFKEGFEVNPDQPLYKLLLERVNSDDRYYQFQDEIEQVVLHDIGLLAKMESFSQREQRVKEYLSLLKDSTLFESWRTNVHSDLQGELIKKKIMVIANEKGWDVQKVLEGKDNNLVEEVISEIIDRDMDALLKRVSETDS